MLLEVVVKNQTLVASDVTQSLTMQPPITFSKKASAFEHERAAGAEDSQ